jgi:large subunit ribosomal protein L25
MKRMELEVSKREVKGKNVRFLRRQGTTPANIYGHGLESTAIQADTKTLKQVVAKAGKTDLVSLKVAGSAEPRIALIREIQRNPLTTELIHVDFYQVQMTEKIKADVPLVFVGDAPALKKKNVSILHLMDTIHIEALPDALPHNLEVDMARLVEIDSALFVKDIPLGAGVTLISDPEQMVVKAAEARREAEEVVAKPAAEGEVIAEGAADAPKAEAAEGVKAKAADGTKAKAK